MKIPNDSVAVDRASDCVIVAVVAVPALAPGNKRRIQARSSAAYRRRRWTFRYAPGASNRYKIIGAVRAVPRRQC